MRRHAVWVGEPPVTSDRRRRLGQWGEALAARHLEAKGYQILARNWRCQTGELDLVVQEGDWLVAVEVRTRRGRQFGAPEESVTLAKQARLVELAEAYVQDSGWVGHWRIDVVAIEVDGTGRLLRIEHYENAVTG